MQQPHLQSYFSPPCEVTILQKFFPSNSDIHLYSFIRRERGNCHILTKITLLLFYGGKVVCVSVRVFYICNSEIYPWLILCIIIQHIFPLYLCVSEFNWEIMGMSTRFVTSWSTKRTSPSGILLFPLPCTGTVWQTRDYEGSLFQNH